jgi:Spy/CpxP family protein refolding chaperone
MVKDMRNNRFKTFILLAASFVFVSAAAAQDPRPPDSTEQQRPAMKPQNDRQFDLLHSLGLTEEQTQQIRKIHLDQKPLMDAAQKRLRESNRALNEAIYSDQLNEADVQVRLRALQVARGEVEKIRFMTELSVRRILTPEQLVRFRELRERFEKTRENMEMHRNDRPGAQPVNHTNQQKPAI